MSTSNYGLPDGTEDFVGVKAKELEDATAYHKEITDKLDVANKELTDIGDINGRPETFYETIKEVYERMKKLTEIVLKTKHIQGFCYTQLTDVEQETNGIYLYDRKTKFNMKLIKKIFKDQAIKIKKGYIQ